MRRGDAHSLRYAFGGHAAGVLGFGHRCNAGNGRLVILSDGRIVPCACGGLPVVGTLDGDAGELFRAGEAFHHSFPLERRELCKGYAEAACC